LVDVVDPKQVVTNSVQLIEIDLNTMKTEDVNLSVPFSIEAKRCLSPCVCDILHIDFSQCHKWVWFSTSPECAYTHWYTNGVLLE